ncbi:GspE/PulE family protein [Domibacillus aminovorans]|uniref:Type II secretion system protein GspE n=1 Tax=Domibacillus aminovorans TaxID=29332 RepID=A0A177LAB9_9BACI|nr:ATPase, T2SS/T4P/T4SS family [Domibacillus aminovorans]OAH62710.1 type II secretion system protein GspE [Domibacillus aminovorans]
MRTQRKRLGDIIVETGLITEAQLKSVLSEKTSDQKLGDALLQRGYITEQQLIEVLEFQLGIPHVSLYQYPVDTKILMLIPKELAKKNLIIPLKKEENRLFVAMADPMDYYTIEDLRLSTGFQIVSAIASKDDIIRAINKYYDIDDSFEEMIQADIEEAAIEQENRDDDSPIVRLVNQIFSHAMAEKASDIHIDPHETKVMVRLRVDGMLHVERQLPKHMQSMLIARIKILANLDITEHRIPQDGRIKTNIEFRPVDLRVSTLPTVYGEKIAMRILDLSSSLNDLNRLGFNKVNLQRVEKMLERPNGIVLITGPTGSGKSSTLYAGLNKLNKEEVNIITIEDPVEYQLEGVNQIQVNPNVGLTFAAGLRSILRQDPNIIMVGEIRDKETAEVAIRASLTGHLVLSTLHTNDSISSITRLIDMGVDSFLVASSVSGIVAQRLVRKVCRDCGREEEATKREIDIFGKRGLKIEKIKRGRGCASCNMTGYKGRIAIHEVLTVTEEMKRLILNEEPLSKLKEAAQKQKTIFLLDDGLLKVRQGVTTTEEILRAVLME